MIWVRGSVSPYPPPYPESRLPHKGNSHHFHSAARGKIISDFSRSKPICIAFYHGNDTQSSRIRADLLQILIQNIQIDRNITGVTAHIHPLIASSEKSTKTLIVEPSLVNCDLTIQYHIHNTDSPLFTMYKVSLVRHGIGSKRTISVSMPVRISSFPFRP